MEREPTMGTLAGAARRLPADRRSRAGLGPRRMRGRLLLAAATATLGVAAGALSAWAGAQAQAAEAARAREQFEWLEHARRQLEHWYVRELATVDARQEAPDARAVIGAADLAMRWGARLRVGPRVEQGEAAGRELLLWIPTGSDPEAPTVRQVRVSGLSLQTAAVMRARSALERLAREFELGYRARFHADPSRDSSVNRFRAQDCLRPLPSEPSCVDAWTDLAAVAWPEGIDAQARTDPWGGPVQVRNDPYPTLQAPHSLRLRTVTPWGRALEVTALAMP